MSVGASKMKCLDHLNFIHSAQCFRNNVPVHHIIITEKIEITILSPTSLSVFYPSTFMSIDVLLCTFLYPSYIYLPISLSVYMTWIFIFLCANQSLLLSIKGSRVTSSSVSHLMAITLNPGMCVYEVLFKSDALLTPSHNKHRISSARVALPIL